MAPLRFFSPGAVVVVSSSTIVMNFSARPSTSDLKALRYRIPKSIAFSFSACRCFGGRFGGPLVGAHPISFSVISSSGSQSYVSSLPKRVFLSSPDLSRPPPA